MSPTIPKPMTRTLSLLLLCLPFSQAIALATDSSQPVYIEADTADMDQLNHVTVYTGNVKIKQGSIRLWGHVVTIYTDENNNLIKAFSDAKKGGDLARFKQTPDNDPEDQWAEGERLEYWANEHLVKVFRQGKLWQGKDIITSDRIIYDTEKELMVSGSNKAGGPKKRVRMTIQPNNK